MGAAPSIKDLTSDLFSALSTHAYFVSISQKLRESDPADPETGLRSVVIRDDGTKFDLVKSRLRTVGFCVIVQPVFAGSARASGGPLSLIDCDLVVTLKLNAQQNAVENRGGDVDLTEAIQKTIQAITSKSRHPGGEFYRAGNSNGDVFQFYQDDEGSWNYHVFFRKEATL